MRYLGNKTKLLNFIDNVIRKYKIEGETFADIFAGTCSVGDYFKDQYNIIANDYMTFSSIICKAKLLNYKIPSFKHFKQKYNEDPFAWLNKQDYILNDNFFIYQNYTPVANRMYFTEENSIKIDGIRLGIEDLYKNGELEYNEYVFLLASLIESVLKVSNTSGTFQAYFKFWESRAIKPFILEPLVFNSVDSLNTNIVYNENSNKLVRKINGDIIYIDPPYTTTQYTNSYHILETIAKYDYPEIFGKTGRRLNREFSEYSNKQNALNEFEDLFRQIKFKHVLVSYSNQSIIPLNELVSLAKLFAENNEVFVETFEYREYATNNLSKKGSNEKLKEVIIYFKKNLDINKSPLNYSGSKDQILPILTTYLPKHIGTFVDTMGGAFNVGSNIIATNCVIYNEYNKYIYEIIDLLLNNKPEYTINKIENIIRKYNLKKKCKDSFIKLRNDYNKCKDPLLLFILHIYSFQNMVRFNSNQSFNTPVGNNEYCENTKNRLHCFKTKTSKYYLLNNKYQDLDLTQYASDTLFYFDPPYFITNAEYNDGKRGLEGWNIDKETELLNFLLNLNEKGYKFMLSNVIQHKNKQHNILIEWVKEHNFNIATIGRTGIKYPREEVVVTNYKIFKEENLL